MRNQMKNGQWTGIRILQCHFLTSQAIAISLLPPQLPPYPSPLLPLSPLVPPPAFNNLVQNNNDLSDQIWYLARPVDSPEYLTESILSFGLFQKLMNCLPDPAGDCHGLCLTQQYLLGHPRTFQDVPAVQIL